MNLSPLAKSSFRRATSAVGLHFIKSPFSRYQLELYEDHQRSHPRYVNIGAGSFHHPLWHNVDMPNDFYAAQQSEFISHDLSSNDPLQIASDSVEIFYCSHVIEHLPNESVRHLFREIHRCLVPGGIFRVTCPDIQLYYRAYIQNDLSFWPRPSGWGTRNSDPEQLFLEYFATLLSESFAARSTRQLSSRVMRDIAERLPMEEFLDSICQMLPPDANQRLPEGHCNWFTPQKIANLLLKAEFTDVWESRYLQSSTPKLRSPCMFDGTCPDQSLYVECRK